MKRWEIEIGASNTVKKTAKSRLGVLRCLRNAQGRVSVSLDGTEIYYGYPDTVRDAIKSDMLWGLI